MQQDQSHLLEQRIGEIAVSRPGATAVFRRHKLDFCCGGEVSFGEAARKRGIEPSVIAAELADLSCDEEPLPDSVEDIVAHILTPYHEVHRRKLAELLRLARKVESVHAERADAPRGLHELLAHMQAELESHMQKEEQVLFPMMLAGGSPMIVRASLGHTGQPLHANAATQVIYLSVLLSAVFRITAAVTGWMTLLEISGALWIAGFALFALTYAPLLLRHKPQQAEARC